MNFNSVKTNTKGDRSTNISRFNLSSISSNCVIVRVRVVLKRTVVGD